MGKVPDIQGKLIIRENEENSKLEKKYGLKILLICYSIGIVYLYFSLFSSLFLVNLKCQNFVQENIIYIKKLQSANCTYFYDKFLSFKDLNFTHYPFSRYSSFEPSSRCIKNPETKRNKLHQQKD